MEFRHLAINHTRSCDACALPRRRRVRGRPPRCSLHPGRRPGLRLGRTLVFLQHVRVVDRAHRRKLSRQPEAGHNRDQHAGSSPLSRARERTGPELRHRRRTRRLHLERRHSCQRQARVAGLDAARADAAAPARPAAPHGRRRRQPARRARDVSRLEPIPHSRLE